MKPRIILIASIFVFFCFSLLFVWFVWFREEQKYPTGRDTRESFGDGRFQIGKTMSDLVLQDEKTNKTLVFPIQDWYRKGDWVYVLGKDGKYTVLNYRTAFHQKFNNLDGAPPEYRDKLAKLK